MYQNCCKKCGSISLHTEVKGSNTGLYCDDCGAWVKWIGKDELKAFEHSQKENNISGIKNNLRTYHLYELNLDKINTVDDCKKILKFLCDLSIKPLPDGVEYGGFSEVSNYLTRKLIKKEYKIRKENKV